MQLDILDLTGFYASPIGRMTRRIVSRKLRQHWPSATNDTVIGLGFATPYLGTFRNEARRTGALMPVAQGAMVWPPTGPVKTVLVEEARLPLADNSVDKLLAIHCLEVSEQARPLLREMWRVLAPEGRLLMIVPNRNGMWSRREATPFGHGQPYSRTQVDKLLRGALFEPLAWSAALHTLPSGWHFAVRWAPTLERLGDRYWPGLAGVLLIEARKEMAATMPGNAPSRRMPRLATQEGLLVRREPALKRQDAEAPCNGLDSHATLG